MSSRLAAALSSGLLASAPDRRPPGAALKRRRRVVVAVTIVIGAALLGWSLAVEPGDPAFYPLAFATAAVWLVGGILSGPLRLGRVNGHRPILLPFLIGLATVAVFVVGALLVRELPFLAGQVDDILDFARQGNLPVVLAVTAVSGIGEEAFFRGALYSAAGRHHPVMLSAVAYTLTTVATGNLMLVFAAAVLSVVWGLQRRASGGILASCITHLTWSLSMALVLPPLFAA